MYLHELKSLRKSTIIWAIVIVALAALFLSMYPNIANDADNYKKLLGGFPAPVRAMLGVNLDYVSSILGFYSLVFSFITLCGAIQGMIFGTSALSKESRERTADFLLVKPVSRSSIVTAKLLASLTMILAIDVVFYAGLTLLVGLVNTKNYDGNTFFLINLTLLFIQLIFFALGMVVSVFFSKLKAVMPLSLGIVLGFYLIGALINGSGKEDVFRYVSPFSYFNANYIIKHANYEASYLIISAIFVIAAIAVSYVVYNKKDIRAVS